MTAPAISTTTVEDIDLTPVCEGRLHDGVRPRADYLIEAHGCTDRYLCDDCMDYYRAADALGMDILCTLCGRQFATVEQVFTTVVRIR